MGLTEKEAAARLKSDGANVLGEKKKVGAVRIFVGQFKDVMVMILLGATVVSSSARSPTPSPLSSSSCSTPFSASFRSFAPSTPSKPSAI